MDTIFFVILVIPFGLAVWGALFTLALIMYHEVWGPRCNDLAKQFEMRRRINDE